MPAIARRLMPRLHALAKSASLRSTESAKSPFGAAHSVSRCSKTSNEASTLRENIDECVCAAVQEGGLAPRLREDTKPPERALESRDAIERGVDENLPRVESRG